jgi:pimeloyl-ACP methyl ester carboxylesterase
MADHHRGLIVRRILLPIEGGAMDTRQLQRGRVQANGAELYYETRGDGPPLLLVAGGLADAGQFTALAEALAEQAKVISYDRRGNSRSPAPAGWTTTTVEEQADDAAALLQALAIPAASVYAHSIGAAIALDLALRRPELVDTVILHDPALMSVLADPGAVLGVVGPLVEEAMAAGGPAAAADAFYRFAVGSALDALEPATWDRMRADGAVLFGVEFQTLSGWRIDEEALRRTRVPVVVLAGVESPPFFREAADWLTERLGGAVEQVPGGHGAPFDHPADIAARVARCMEQAKA